MGGAMQLSRTISLAQSGVTSDTGKGSGAELKTRTPLLDHLLTGGEPKLGRTLGGGDLVDESKEIRPARGKGQTDQIRMPVKGTDRSISVAAADEPLMWTALTHAYNEVGTSDPRHFDRLYNFAHGEGKHLQGAMVTYAKLSGNPRLVDCPPPRHIMAQTRPTPMYSTTTGTR